MPRFQRFHESSDTQARTNLRNLAQHLCKVLPDADRFLLADTQTLQWNGDAPFTLDVAEFEQVAARAEQAEKIPARATALEQFERAAALYPGSLLPGCYDDWIAPYAQLFREWKSPRTGGMHKALSDWGPAFVQEHGDAATNPEFWRDISATSFVQDITAPVQLHHSPNDVEAPFAFSEFLARELERNGKTVEFYAYPGDNHNLSENFNIAMQRTLDFFDRFQIP